MSKTIGIDFGSRQCCVAHWEAQVRVLQNRENEDLTPAAVCWFRGEMVVGAKALDRMGAAPTETVLEVRSLLGQPYSDPVVQRLKAKYPFRMVPASEGDEDDLRVLLGDQERSPIQIAALILEKLRQDAAMRLNGKVEYAVITVPAYFTEKQKWAVRTAGRLAGLKVQRILDEPTAAAIAFGVDRIPPEEARTVLVFDLGKGACDVSLLTLSGGLFALVNIEGDMWLGGDNFHYRIVDYVLQQLRVRYGLDPSGDARFMAELVKRAEKAKEELCSLTHTDIDLLGLRDAHGNELAEELELTRDQFERLIADDVQRCLEIVDRSLDRVRFRPADIDHVILAGGSSVIPVIRRGLIERFGEQKILMNVDPRKCVAYGAAILAARLGEVWDCPAGHQNPLENARCAVCGAAVEEQREQAETFFGVTSQSVGIQLEGDKFEVVIAKGAYYPTPAPVVRQFSTPQANLRRIRVAVYQGESPKASENELLVTLWLELPKNLPANTPVDVGFRLDNDGILDQVTVALKDGSGRQVQVYCDRGDERRSRLESKLERLRLAWEAQQAGARRRFEASYGQVIDALNGQDLHAAEAALAVLGCLLETPHAVPGAGIPAGGSGADRGHS